MPFKGLIAAAFTPMRADGSLAIDRIRPLVDALVSDGVSGLYILGSTGEGLSLSREERQTVAEAYIEAASGRLRTIVQVGHNSLAEARRLARHADDAGADAISATPPSYFRPESLEVLVACAREVAEAAPDLPFYYYHIPAATGVDLAMPAFLKSARKAIPNLAGVKFSDPRHHVLQACIEEADETMEVFTGVDEMLLGALAVGVHGAVGTTYNFAAPLYRRLAEAFARREIDEARRLQQHAVAMVDTVLSSCGRSGFKALMALIGRDCGPSRLPVRTPDDEEIARMRTGLEAIGFFDWSR